MKQKYFIYRRVILFASTIGLSGTRNCWNSSGWKVVPPVEERWKLYSSRSFCNSFPPRYTHAVFWSISETRFSESRLWNSRALRRIFKYFHTIFVERSFYFARLSADSVFHREGGNQTRQIDTNRVGFVARGNLYDPASAFVNFAKLSDREVVRFLSRNVLITLSSASVEKYVSTRKIIALDLDRNWFTLTDTSFFLLFFFLSQILVQNTRYAL